MIEYADSADGITAGMLAGFFEGWPDPPSPETHLRILRGADHVVLALDGNRVVGFVNAISDGILSAYIPLLEVLPEYRRRGIGSTLLRRLLDRLNGLYMIDLVCDVERRAFYERFGFVGMTAMARRDFTAQSGRTEKA